MKKTKTSLPLKEKVEEFPCRAAGLRIGHCHCSCSALCWLLCVCLIPASGISICWGLQKKREREEVEFKYEDVIDSYPILVNNGLSTFSLFLIFHIHTMSKTCQQNLQNTSETWSLFFTILSLSLAWAYICYTATFLNCLLAFTLDLFPPTAVKVITWNYKSNLFSTLHFHHI